MKYFTNKLSEALGGEALPDEDTFGDVDRNLTNFSNWLTITDTVPIVVDGLVRFIRGDNEYDVTDLVKGNYRYGTSTVVDGHARIYVYSSYGATPMRHMLDRDFIEYDQQHGWDVFSQDMRESVEALPDDDEWEDFDTDVRRAQLIIQDEMLGAYDDDYSDKLDGLYVILIDAYGFSEEVAGAAIRSDWHHADIVDGLDMFESVEALPDEDEFEDDEDLCDHCGMSVDYTSRCDACRNVYLCQDCAVRGFVAFGDLQACRNCANNIRESVEALPDDDEFGSAEERIAEIIDWLDNNASPYLEQIDGINNLKYIKLHPQEHDITDMVRSSPWFLEDRHFEEYPDRRINALGYGAGLTVRILLDITKYDDDGKEYRAAANWHNDNSSWTNSWVQK